MGETVVMDDVFYGQGVFYLAPVSDEYLSEEYRGIVSMDADEYQKVADKDLLNQRAQVTLIADDNSQTDTEGWTGVAGVRTIKTEGAAPKPQLMIGREDVQAIIGHGITDGTIVDVTIAKLA